MAIGTSMPPIPANAGSASLDRTRNSPISISRRASSPTTMKKNAISPELTNCCRSMDTPYRPAETARWAAQNLSYDVTLMFAQIRAATVAPASTDALPVSVRMNVRNGVWPRRAHAVKPENGVSVTAGFSRIRQTKFISPNGEIDAVQDHACPGGLP